MAVVLADFTWIPRVSGFIIPLLLLFRPILPYFWRPKMGHFRPAVQQWPLAAPMSALRYSTSLPFVHQTSHLVDSPLEWLLSSLASSDESSLLGFCSFFRFFNDELFSLSIQNLVCCSHALFIPFRSFLVLPASQIKLFPVNYWLIQTSASHSRFNPGKF